MMKLLILLFLLYIYIGMNMQRKKKRCKKCELEKYLWSNGMCQLCWNSENPVTFKKTPINKKEYKIVRVSKVGKDRTKRYSKLRALYLNKHQICEVCNHKQATEIHHKRGRDGDNLFNHFLAVCRDCHQMIETNPHTAYKNGWTESRLKNKEDEV